MKIKLLKPLKVRQKLLKEQNGKELKKANVTDAPKKEAKTKKAVITTKSQASKKKSPKKVSNK